MSVKKLKKWATCPNIAAELDDECLAKIGQQVLLGFHEDEKSNADWLADIKKVEELASLKSVKKSYPLPNSANIKLPLITKACYEFSSRVHPEIVRDEKIVKGKVIGKQVDDFKLKMSQRTCDFMNYQLLMQDGEWQQQLVKLLVRLALIGFICKKTYYDPIRKKIKHILCKPEELIIHADSASLEDAPRISHVLHYRMNDLVEHMNTKEDEYSLFLEKPVKELLEQNKDDDLNRCIDGIEQCTYLDLDEDGYKEPYIVTVLKDSGKVLRIVAQYEKDDIYSEGKDEVCYINKEEYYEDFHFLPNPKGTFQSVGFGILLLHLNEASNSIMNQLVDAGQLSNMKGGYMDARLKQIPTGNSLHDAGEFKLLKVMAGGSLKDGILPLQYGEPSSTLYQLLGLLIDVSRDLTSSAQINNGTQSSENAKTGATMALQAEGRKIFNSINKSIYNSLSKEFNHIFKLNGKYISQETYMDVLDDPMARVEKDFDTTKVNVIPIADPNLSSDQQRLGEAAMIQQLMSLPGIDPVKATKLILQRVSIPGIEGIMVDEKSAQQPNIDMLKFQAETEGHAQELNLKGAQLDLQEKELVIKTHVADADIAVKQAQADLYVAQALALKSTQEIKQAELEFGIVSKHVDLASEIEQRAHEKDLRAAKQQMSAIEAPGAPNGTSEGSDGVDGESSNPTPAGPDTGA